MSRLRESGPLIEYVDERLAAGDPIGVTSASLLEVAYGFRRAADAGDPGFHKLLQWLKRFVREGRVELLPLDHHAAIVAGEVRARNPSPPSPRHGRRRRSKAELRAAWILDIQVAATAWTSGRDIATADAEHFEAIAAAIAELAPRGPELLVFSPPV